MLESKKNDDTIFLASSVALANAESGYRLRSGDFRVLFDSNGETVVIRRVLDRRDAHR